MERLSQRAERWERVRYWRSVRVRLKRQRASCNIHHGYYSRNLCWGRREARRRGWGRSQFGCLVQLWNFESRWRHWARNPSSGAGGIPQALPASKMASAGADWATNPRTQIRWGLGYIAVRYGTPCGALGHFHSHHWY